MPIASREVRSGDIGVFEELDDTRVAEGAAAAEVMVVPLKLPTGDSCSSRPRFKCRSDLLGARREVIGVDRPLVLTRSWGVEESAEAISVEEEVR